MKTFSDIIELTKQRVDETDADEQVLLIIKEAINHSYIFDLSQIEENFNSTIVPVINGLASLPSDLNKIVKTSPSLVNGEYKRGNAIFSDREIDFTIIYSIVPSPLVNPTDVPKVSSKCLYTMSTYACAEYFKYRKKNAAEQMFRDSYEREKVSLYDNGSDEVIETYGGDD
jgi:hypothetical protein